MHVVENGDSGWRIGYQHAPRGNAGPWNTERLWYPRHPSQPAYIIPPICNIEDGPSGIAYYPGTGLTSDYAGKIFITHFKGSISSSGIYTYKVKPAGASYAIEDAAPFLTNALPTDVRFGPDGKLYYSDWAEGWPKSRKGRIYAMFSPEHINDPLVKATQALIASDSSKKSDAELAFLLAQPDTRVRLEAQYTLAERGASSIPVLAAVATKTDASPLARRHAIWGLGQLTAKNSAAVLPILRSLLADPDAEVRAQSIKLLGDYNDQTSSSALIAALGDPAPRVKFFAAQSLGKLKSADATPALLATIRTNADADATLRHALVMGLVGCTTPAQLAATAKDDSRAVRLAAVLALRRLRAADIAQFLTDADPLIVREVAEAISDAPIPAAFPALATFVEHPVNNEATMLRALNIRFRLGTAADAAALAHFAAQPEASAALRVEAITLLSLWSKPPARDRLVGVYRPLTDKTRPAEIAPQVLAPHLNTLLANTAPESVRAATIEFAVTFKLMAATPALHALMGDAGQPTNLRVTALTALDKLADPQLPAAVTAALAAASPELRLAALPISSRLAPESSIATLSKLLASGTPLEQRAVFKALAESKQPEVDAILLTQLNLLAAGKIAPVAQLDLIEAAARRTDPHIKQMLADRDAALAKDPDPLAPFRVALEGGDIAAGMKTFRSQPVMQCIRCHRIGDAAGGDAGPNLGGIGARESREYILQSIIKPSAKIAAGFEIATVTRKNGQAIVGTIVQRDDKGIHLRSGETEVIEIPAADIKSVESAPSAMPELAALVMTKAEIRDLVEAVASLRTAPTKIGAAKPRALTPAPTD